MLLQTSGAIYAANGVRAMQIGLYSFAENTPDPLNGGHLQSPAERLRDLLEEIETLRGRLR